MSSNVEFKHVSKFDVPEQSPGFLLWHVSLTWRSSIEALLKKYGLTHPQFVVLATTGWLTRNGERVTQLAIGRMAGFDPNTNAQIIKGLVLKKLIKRLKSSDPRAKNPLLTTQGSELLKQVLPAVEKADREFFQRLNAQELSHAVSLFQKLISK